jgi:hypothetical protein
MLTYKYKLTEMRVHVCLTYRHNTAPTAIFIIPPPSPMTHALSHIINVRTGTVFSTGAIFLYLSTSDIRITFRQDISYTEVYLHSRLFHMVEGQTR